MDYGKYVGRAWAKTATCNVAASEECTNRLCQTVTKIQSRRVVAPDEEEDSPFNEQFRGPRLAIVPLLTILAARPASMKWAAAAHMSGSDRPGSQAVPPPPLAEAR